MIVILSSHGEIYVNKNGRVIDNTACTDYKDVVSFDLKECNDYWKMPMQDEYDICDVGIHLEDGSFEPPEESFREMITI